jgi:predicted nuclease of predicted toxin-antitoxin system
VKILANENLYEPIIDYLRAQGHEVLSCRSRELSGASDDVVYRKAVDEGRVIVTMDKDFLKMRRFPPDACGGIIVVKIYRWSVADATRMFRQSFEQLNEEAVKGKLVIINPDGVRTRSPRRRRS